MRPSLSLSQWMKLVAASALASAYTMPFVRLAQAEIADWPTMLAVLAVGEPLVFALATIMLARRGPLKEWLIRALCIASAGAAMAVLGQMLGWTLLAWSRGGMPAGLAPLAASAALGLQIAVLGLAVAFLARGAARARDSMRRGAEPGADRP